MTPVYERYAGALFRAAENLGCSDTVIGELAAMDELIKQCGNYLNDPLISAGTKVAILRELLSGKVSPLILEYTLIMTSHRHLKHFHNAAEFYLQLSGHGKTIVTLRVPFKPDQDILEQIKSRLIKDKLIPEGSRETELKIVEDEKLIGGLIASCNGYQIDTSLRTALQKLRMN